LTGGGHDLHFAVAQGQAGFATQQATHFSATHCADGMSPSVLITRMKELREAALVELAEGGYQLTLAGRELIRQLKPLNRWAESWGRQFS